jgi:hypothetical protein
MKYIEIVFKLTFLALAIVLFVTKDIPSLYFYAFLAMSLILGIVLFFNKHESYGYPAWYPKMNRVYMIRKIEGVLLVAFSVVFLVWIR